MKKLIIFVFQLIFNAFIPWMLISLPITAISIYLKYKDLQIIDPLKSYVDFTFNNWIYVVPLCILIGYPRAKRTSKNFTTFDVE